MRKLIFPLLCLCLLTSCQDVIEVDVPIDEPRLVLDAVIRLDDITQTTFTVRVRASITSSFFGDIEPATLDRITLSNETSNVTEILEQEGSDSGIYTKEVSMDMLTEGELTLSVNYKNQIYTAKTRFVPAVPIDSLQQGNSTLFSGDETEVLISFTDAPNRVDFYLFDFDFGQYLVSEDTFYPGQSFQFSYFYDTGVKPGMEVDISILGVDEPFFNYMNQLIVQSGGDQGPFQTPAATVKGNIINTTETANFALGYFAVSQIFSRSLVIE